MSDQQKPRVLMETNLGNLTIELFPQEAPETVDNFTSYAKDSFFDGTIFHRVIDGFMVQGGGFDTDFRQKETRPPIKNEADNGLENKRGAVAMARTSDIHSATSQFFINLNDNDFLNHQGPSPDQYGYCVFGEVVDGMDVVDDIKESETGSRGPHQDVPLEDVVIERARILD